MSVLNTTNPHSEDLLSRKAAAERGRSSPTVSTNAGRATASLQCRLSIIRYG